MEWSLSSNMKLFGKLTDLDRRIPTYAVFLLFRGQEFTFDNL